MSSDCFLFQVQSPHLLCYFILLDYLVNIFLICHISYLWVYLFVLFYYFIFVVCAICIQIFLQLTAMLDYFTLFGAILRSVSQSQSLMLSKNPSRYTPLHPYRIQVSKGPCFDSIRALR